MRSLTTQDVKGKRILVRIDVDVELAGDRKTIASDFKLRSQISTIEWLRRNGAKAILVGHFGRPDGKKDANLSLAPMAKIFSELLRKRVKLLGDCVGDEVEDEVLHMKNEDVVLLENVRFHKGETENDMVFARRLARLADIYVNNAFANCHRKHASMVAIAGLLPSYAGILLEKEVLALSLVLKNPKRPLVLVIGGAKIETKLPIIKNFLKNASAILVGGAVANTFFAGKGYRTEASRVERDFIPVARRLLKNRKIVLPIDVVTSPNPHGKKGIAFRDAKKIQSGEMILDIGQKSLERFSAHIHKAGTVVWNGPMGLFEIAAFAHGTDALARIIASSKAYKVVGGGETGIVLKNLGIEDKINHISTGGGAMLEFLGGKRLSGLEALGYYK